MICENKLARVLSGNISKVISDEKNKDRFTMYFNTFIKTSIPVFLAKEILEKYNDTEDDILGNSNEEDDDYLPKLRSNRLFNFVNR